LTLSEPYWEHYVLARHEFAFDVSEFQQMDGKVVHAWKMPYPPGLYGYLTERGTLFYNGKIPNDTFLGEAPFKGGTALEADWSGKVLWERHPNHHHDGRLLRNGNVLLLCATELPDEVAKKVRGGRPGTEDKGKIWADYLVEITKDGRTVWEWRTWEHLDPAKDAITEIQGGRSEWTHGNAIVELPDGNLLVSFRDISTIIKIERRTGRMVWKLGAPPLSGQHAPTPLPNGNILIFDNGAHRLDESFPFSRVIEVNPPQTALCGNIRRKSLRIFSVRASPTPNGYPMEIR
jgi:Arylsulfotransferase (ASST)